MPPSPSSLLLAELIPLPLPLRFFSFHCTDFAGLAFATVVQRLDDSHDDVRTAAAACLAAVYRAAGFANGNATAPSGCTYPPLSATITCNLCACLTRLSTHVCSDDGDVPFMWPLVPPR